MKKTIAVLFGGYSPEYPISLKSAYAVLTHMDCEKYQIIPVGITRDGRWFRYLGEYERILNDTWHDHPNLCRAAFLSPDRSVHGLCEVTGNSLTFTWIDAVFPVLHGKNGEDGTVQGLAQAAGIPVVGCGAMSSALSMDKYRAHLLAEAAGVKAPKAIHLTQQLSDSQLMEEVSHLSYPLFVKPLRAGSSFGITKVTDPSALSGAAELAFQYDSEIIIEENIDGFEVGCAVLGSSHLTLGRVDEIELGCGFFDYTEKYTQETARIHMPARIDAEKEAEIQKAAVKIYRILGCSGFARVDLFLTAHGEIVFNEVNTIPGFTAVSRYPNMLKGIGMGYGEIIEALLTDALEKEES